jgi:hypothetical protein
MKYPTTKRLFFLDAETVKNTADNNDEKRDDLTSRFIPSDNIQRHKRFIEDLAKEVTSGKGIWMFPLHPFVLYVILNRFLLKDVLQCLSILFSRTNVYIYSFKKRA